MSEQANPFVGGPDPEPTVDDLFNQEVNTKEAAEVLKRNLPPQGTYVTTPEEYPGTVSRKRVDEKDVDGDPTGTSRRIASIIIRGEMKRRGENPTATMLRFDLSPESRPKKVFEDKQWTGEYVEGKDDLTSQLWAAAVKIYTDVKKEPPSREDDVLEFLAKGTYGIRTMRGDDRLIVLGLQARKQG